MRIATNVTRDYIGGITRSNVVFMDSLQGKGKGIVGIELNSKRFIQGPTMFKHFSSDWFQHNIINIHDLPIKNLIKKSKNLKDLENEYRPIIKIIKDILLKEKPNIVFLNGTYYIPWLISIAAYELKIPIVLRYAGVYTKETENTKPKERKIFNQIEKSFQKRVNFFIFPSKICKKVVEQEVYKKDIKNSTVIPNAFDVNFESKNVKKNKKVKIAAVGRWDGIKNFKKFFEIHKSLNKQKWDHEAYFVTGDSHIKEIPKTIKRLNAMKQADLLKFYASKDLVISPSTFETFGNVPIEAIMTGTPVLVSDTMGCSEILKKVKLNKMVISFNDDEENILEKIKLLSLERIDENKIKEIKNVLDPKKINKKIKDILRKYSK
jgi:glycosyltransferase involved in cell wall biosynthesis